MKLKSIINILITSLISLYTVINVLLNTHKLSVVANVIIISVMLLMIILNILGNLKNYKSLVKMSIVISVGICVVYLLYITLYNLNILHIFSSVELLKQYIIDTKEKGILIYILIQILQVVFVPIPAAVIAIVGSLIYGPILGAVYCTLGILLGSYISYIIGKTFGYKIVSWIVGKDSAHKYAEILCKRGAIFLGIAFLLPLFPDDILCLIAGISTMKFSTFFLVTTITRPIGVIFMCVFGSGQVIPYSGWGLVVWVSIIVVAVGLIFILYKYQEKLQNWIYSKLNIKI